jgi:hypothetical protein
MFLKATLKQLLVNPDELTDDVLTQLMEVGRNPDSGRAWRAF